MCDQFYDFLISDSRLIDTVEKLAVNSEQITYLFIYLFVYFYLFIYLFIAFCYYMKL